MLKIFYFYILVLKIAMEIPWYVYYTLILSWSASLCVKNPMKKLHY